MCDCVKQMNEQLAEHKQELRRLMIINRSTDAQMQLSSPVLATEWIGGKKPRGKKLMNVMILFCPFCGEEYDTTQSAKS